MKTTQKIAAGAAIGVTFSLASLWLHDQGTFDEPEADTWKMRIRLLAEQSDAPIKLILLDESSLEWAKGNGYTWTWSRDLYSYILRFTREAGVKAVAFDVQYTDGHKNFEGDQSFTAEIAKTPNLIMAMLPSDRIGVIEKWPDDVTATFHEFHEEHSGEHSDQENIDADLVTNKARLPFDDFRKAAHLFAHIHGEVGAGNYISDVIPLQIFDSRRVLLLGLAAASLGDAKRIDDRWQLPALSLQGDGLHVGDRVVPLDKRGRTLLNYYRPLEGTDYAFEVYTAADIIASGYALEIGEKPKIDPATFRDNYVFFGFSAPALYDLKPTPFGSETPGVEVHATAAANFLEGSFITPAPPIGVFLWTIMLAVGAAIGTVFAKRAKQVAIVCAIMLPLPVIAGLLAYGSHIWWPIIAPATATAFSLVGGIVLNYATEGKQRRFIRRAFERYLNPGVIDELVDDPEKLSLGGTERELSIFFADLSGFTSMSAVMTPAEITGLLNAVLTEMTSVIFEEDGTLDKYIGDAIVAFWNAPTDQPDHATRAVHAAIRCQQRLTEKMSDFEKLSHGHSISMRIGIHTGRVVVGNMGSEQQFNYSIIGDAANLASRLEGANKAFGTPIMISEATWSQTNNAYSGRRLANLQVVGRPDPVVVHQPFAEIGEAKTSDAIKSDAITLFERAMALGDNGQWRAAKELLETLQDDVVAAAYVQYLTDLGDDIDQWDGVWRMTKK